MVLDVGACDGKLLGRMPTILTLACRRGDAEMVELLVRAAQDSIKASSYGLALLEACHSGHEDVIRVIATDCSQYIDLRTNIFTDSHVKRMDPDVVILVNSLFGSSIDSTGGTRTIHKPMTYRGQSIRYNGASIMYPSYKP